MFDILTKSPLFKGLDAVEVEASLNTVNFKIKQFGKEQLIASRGEKCANLLVLLEGSVRGEMLDYSGKVLKVEDIEAPKPIAAAFLFGQSNSFPVDVVANTDVKLLCIQADSVVQLFQANSIFLKNYLNAISNRAQFLSKRIWFLSFKTIKGKLAQYILNLAQPDKTQVKFTMTQQELAEFFGVTRPSLARALGDMEKNGIIEANRKDITIIKKSELVKLLE